MFLILSFFTEMIKHYLTQYAYIYINIYVCVFNILFVLQFDTFNKYNVLNTGCYNQLITHMNLIHAFLNLNTRDRMNLNSRSNPRALNFECTYVLHPIYFVNLVYFYFLF